MLDWTRIDELLAEIGEADFGEVVTLFLEEADMAVDTLASRPADSALEEVLHFLKGSALNLGFADLALLCAEGERGAARGCAVDPGPVIATYVKSRTALKQGLASRRAT